MIKVTILVSDVPFFAVSVQFDNRSESATFLLPNGECRDEYLYDLVSIEAATQEENAANR